jgi:hypothetical protein
MASASWKTSNNRSSSNGSSSDRSSNKIAAPRKALLILACLMATCPAWAQLRLQPEEPPRLEAAFTYDYVHANVTTGVDFSMQGGSAQVQARLWHGMGIVGDVAGFHTGNVNNTGVGLDLITATFGPRFTLPAHHRIILFGQVLAGIAHGMNSEFPSSTTLNSSGNSVALQMGGGVNYQLTHHFSARLVDANWLRTQLPNATTDVQNNFRIGAGFVCSFR